MDSLDLFAIERRHLEHIRAIRDQLYREERLLGDRQRDMAQVLHAILDYAMPFELPRKPRLSREAVQSLREHLEACYATDSDIATPLEMLLQWHEESA